MIIIHTQPSLEQLAARHDRLEQQYQIKTAHNVIFDLFIEAPDHFERWIHIYFANPALFSRRLNGGKVLLLSFLLFGPDEILAALLVAKSNDANDAPELLPLLPRQQAVAAAMREVCKNGYASACDWIQDLHDKFLGGHRMVGVHGNRYIQPMKHFEPTAKWKSRGGHEHV